MILQSNKANSHTSEVEVHTKLKLCHFCHYWARAKPFCPSCRGLSVHVGKFSSQFLNSGVTGLACLLIWTHWNLTKEIGVRWDISNRAHMKRPLVTFSLLVSESPCCSRRTKCRSFHRSCKLSLKDHVLLIQSYDFFSKSGTSIDEMLIVVTAAVNL